MKGMSGKKRTGLWVFSAIVMWTILYPETIQASGMDLDKKATRQLYSMGIAGSVVSLGMTLVNRRAMHTPDAGRITGLLGAVSGVWTTGYGFGVAALYFYYSDEYEADYLALGMVTSAIGIVSTYYGVKAFKHGRSGAITDDKKIAWKLDPIVISTHENRYNLGIQFSASF